LNDILPQKAFMKIFRLCVFTFLLAAVCNAPSAFAASAKTPKGVALETDRPDLEFSLHCLGSGTGPTLLVVGGIQGDEPGGFSAGSLLVTSYSIKSGQVWVVPNLNFLSIVKRSRGMFGDMNRKFAHHVLYPKDPNYEAVKKKFRILSAHRK
jgi:predicted deacylase